MGYFILPHPVDMCHMQEILSTAKSVKTCKTFLRMHYADVFRSGWPFLCSAAATAVRQNSWRETSGGQSLTHGFMEAAICIE